MKRRRENRLFGDLKAGLREVLEIERGNIEPVSYVEVESPRISARRENFNRLVESVKELVAISRGEIEPAETIVIPSPKAVLVSAAVKPITSEAENEKALKIIEALMVKPSLTQAEDEYLEKLFSAVEDFERVAYPLDLEREKGGRY